MNTIYLLCENEDGKDGVYIGEAENVYARLNQHIQDYNSGKEEYYWNKCLVLQGSDLNKTYIRYLEDRFVSKAREIDKLEVLTKNTFRNTVIDNEDIDWLEEFIEDSISLISTLGYTFLENNNPKVLDNDYLYCCDAKGYLSKGGFTVTKDSKVNPISNDFKERGYNYFMERLELESDGVIVNDTFTKDYEFPSPTCACAVVLGHTAKGLHNWKDKDRICLKGK